MRILIVDDDPLARSHLARLCQKLANVIVIAEAHSGAAAIQAFQSSKPDLVLLDIQLHDMTGFEVLQACSTHCTAHTIIVSGHMEHAVQAFQIGVIDYITKPVSVARLEAAIARARARILQERQPAEINGRTPAADLFRNVLRRLFAPPRHLVGERLRKLYFVDVERIDFISADANYVRIHSGGETYISRNTLKLLEERLRGAGFVRVQRSLLVNLRQVAFAERLGQGIFSFTLRNGQQLLSGSSYRRAISQEMRALQEPL